MACSNNWLHTQLVVNELIARGRALEDERRRRFEAVASREPPCAPELRNPEAHLREYIGGGWAPPPMYRLAASGARPHDSQGLAAIERLALDLNERDDSGVFELHAGPRDPVQLRETSGRLADYVYDIAKGLDQRDFKSLEIESSFVRADFRSMMPSGSPVIGPGGRITVYHGSRLAADIVVRRRTGEIQSSWMDPGFVFSQLIDRISREPGELVSEEIWTSFGYFELSKYERQHVMRPAFAFMFVKAGDVYVSPEGEEHLVQWQVGYAHAATEAPDVSLLEGLGQWGSIEGRGL